MSKIEFLENNLFAHRGYFNNKDIPENSIKSFKKAIRYGYNIELDVHLTKDEKVVVFHDFNLKRMCNVNKNIEECTYDELLKYNLLDTNCKIPLLSDVLNVVDKKVVLLIETKVKNKKSKLEMNLSKILDNYNGLFAIQSFSPFSIYWFKKNRKEYKRGLLLSGFKDKKINNIGKIILRTILSDIILKTDFISFDVKALPSSYISFKRKYKTILGWTIKNKKSYEKAAEYCDNMIAEDIKSYNQY